MNTKHTPGPWTLGNENNHCCEVCIGEAIASLSRNSYYDSEYVIERDEMLANAHLIMSAPDLLEALQSILDFPPSDLEGWASGHAAVPITLQPHHIQKAIEAIKKATL